jgi:hypothetical protein
MPKSSEVAAELRKLADALDREPEQELPVTNVDFYCKYAGVKGKPMFLALVRILPHPLTKSDDDMGGLELKYTTPSLCIRTVVERDKVCKLIRPAQQIPAKYECEPLLTTEEDASLTEA